MEAIDVDLRRDGAPVLTGSVIEQVVRNVWGSILGIEVELVSGPVHEALRTSESAAGIVQISGEFDLAVIVHLSEVLACRSVSLMLDIALEDVSREEVPDAVGELANIVGGSIKNLLPGDFRLSVPTVAGGLGFTLHLPGMRQVHRSSFLCLGQPLTVTLLAREGL